MHERGVFTWHTHACVRTTHEPRWPEQSYRSCTERAAQRRCRRGCHRSPCSRVPIQHWVRCSRNPIGHNANAWDVLERPDRPSRFWLHESMQEYTKFIGYMLHALLRSWLWGLMYLRTYCPSRPIHWWNLIPLSISPAFLRLLSGECVKWMSYYMSTFHSFLQRLCCCVNCLELRVLLRMTWMKVLDDFKFTQAFGLTSVQ